MGYKCPIDVLPIIIPMSDYDKAPDKSVVKKYLDDYVNILFTGRIAPNKKQENLISAFYITTGCIIRSHVLYWLVRSDMMIHII